MLSEWLTINESQGGDFSANWIKLNTKPCPNCKTLIEKGQGCMFMHCSRCQFEFCWLCMTHQPGHRAHSCGTF